MIIDSLREHSSSVVEYLTQDQGATGLSLTGITVLCPLARHIYPSLVLVQPRWTHPDITETLLIGTIRIKSNKIDSLQFFLMIPSGVNRLAAKAEVSLQTYTVIFAVRVAV